MNDWVHLGSYQPEKPSDQTSTPSLLCFWSLRCLLKVQVHQYAESGMSSALPYTSYIEFQLVGYLPRDENKYCLFVIYKLDTLYRAF